MDGVFRSEVRLLSGPHALSIPACRAGLKGDRWSSDYRVHFNRCLRAAIPKVESERGARAGYLWGCGGL